MAWPISISQHLGKNFARQNHNNNLSLISINGSAYERFKSCTGFREKQHSLRNATSKAVFTIRFRKVFYNVKPTFYACSKFMSFQKGDAN